MNSGAFELMLVNCYETPVYAEPAFLCNLVFPISVIWCPFPAVDYSWRCIQYHWSSCCSSSEVRLAHLNLHRFVHFIYTAALNFFFSNFITPKTAFYSNLRLNEVTHFFIKFWQFKPCWYSRILFVNFFSIFIFVVSFLLCINNFLLFFILYYNINAQIKIIMKVKIL